jgi:hypothetical protein
MDRRDRKVRIAIIGSRRRADRDAVEGCVAELPIGTIVVSGGARGPDTWAEEAARARGLPVIVRRPHLAGVTSPFDATERYYGRNQRIVDDCDRLIAFPAPDRKGGTEDTIRRALRAGKPVELR